MAINKSTQGNLALFRAVCFLAYPAEKGGKAPFVCTKKKQDGPALALLMHLAGRCDIDKGYKLTIRQGKLGVENCLSVRTVGERLGQLEEAQLIRRSSRYGGADNIWVNAKAIFEHRALVELWKKEADAEDLRFDPPAGESSADDSTDGLELVDPQAGSSDTPALPTTAAAQSNHPECETDNADGEQIESFVYSLDAMPHISIALSEQDRRRLAEHAVKEYGEAERILALANLPEWGLARLRNPDVKNPYGYLREMLAKKVSELRDVEKDADPLDDNDIRKYEDALEAIVADVDVHRGTIGLSAGISYSEALLKRSREYSAEGRLPLSILRIECEGDDRSITLRLRPMPSDTSEEPVDEVVA